MIRCDCIRGDKHETAARRGVMLTTLSDKVLPEHCALLVVDVQNDFAAEGGAMHREGRGISMAQAMVPRLERLLEAARTAKAHIVWIRNVYNTGPNWYLSEVWLEQAKRRRKGAYIDYPVCQPQEWNGDFYRIRPKPDEGIATNVCVETTARQAFLRDYYVVFTSDCTATYSQAQHEATLENIDQFFGQVVTSEE